MNEINKARVVTNTLAPAETTNKKTQRERLISDISKIFTNALNFNWESKRAKEKLREDLNDIIININMGHYDEPTPAMVQSTGAVLSTMDKHHEPVLV